MPPSPTRPLARSAVKTLVVPKEEAEITGNLAKLKLSKQDGENQPTGTRRTPLKQILKLDADVKPMCPTIPDLYPHFATQDVKPKVEARDPGLVTEENAIVSPEERRAYPGIEVVLPSWRDVRKAKADRARDIRTNIHQRNARSAAAADVEEENDLSLRDVADLDRPQSTLRDAVEEMKNPDAKVKKELLLSDEFLLNALSWEGINHRHPIPLPKHIAEFGFSRAYISHLYGGSPQDVFPPPSKEKVEWHGLNDWAFLSLEWNPHAPTRPGYSGLYFTMDRAATCDERQTLEQVKRTFIRLGPNRWIYLGQYKFTPGVSLTTALWTEQSIQVRRAWARGILVKGWGESVLLRIWFRRERGVDFEPKKDDMMKGAKKRIEQIRMTMTEEDVIGAYNRGEEEIGTFRMMCTGYDTEFLRVLQRNAHSFVPPPPKPKKPKKSCKPKQERDTSTRGTKRKAGSNVGHKGMTEAKSESDEDRAHLPGKGSMTMARANAKRRRLA